ncbi:macro domain-containing protein [Xenorhabdus bovienii]|uniref:macro domain-containing protein n=1 Tax=Xenorhabdus bovienii TaxID=40576 RepID=UPI0004D56BC6|nr:macro domain-containing protein [Xenorhabdus bovienii]CDG92165.1 conserved hypothetical protein [Xenorhabdus bovienii str. feltiae Florida]
MKVGFFDKIVWKEIINHASIISVVFTITLAFVDIPKNIKIFSGVVFLVIFLVLYIFLLYKANQAKLVEIKIDGSNVIVKFGDIFKEEGYKAIAFNEYFDTEINDRIISHSSLNGQYINNHLECSIDEINGYIKNYKFNISDFSGVNNDRKVGKKQKYKIGTICVHGEYLLTAFSKFNENNEARLTMPEYLGFLICFWDQVNRVYAQKSVSVPVFGSGITRIKEHKNISDEELLKIMLWTYRISEMRFKYPAKLSIIIHESKRDLINLYELKSVKNGI